MWSRLENDWWNLVSHKLQTLSPWSKLCLWPTTKSHYWPMWRHRLAVVLWSSHIDVDWQWVTPEPGGAQPDTEGDPLFQGKTHRDGRKLYLRLKLQTPWPSVSLILTLLCFVSFLSQELCDVTSSQQPVAAYFNCRGWHLAKLGWNQLMRSKIMNKTYVETRNK